MMRHILVLIRVNASVRIALLQWDVAAIAAGTPRNFSTLDCVMNQEFSDPLDFDRGLVLDALNLMACGRQIRVFGGSAHGISLDGMPVAPAFDFLLRFGYIRPLNPVPGEFFGLSYGLTRKGYKFWQDGLEWWRSLSIVQKIKVRLFGKA